MTQRMTGRPFVLSICHVIVGRVRSTANPAAEIVAKPLWRIGVAQTKCGLVTVFVSAPLHQASIVTDLQDSDGHPTDGDLAYRVWRSRSSTVRRPLVARKTSRIVWLDMY
jgi:hypothetical protein